MLTEAQLDAYAEKIWRTHEGGWSDRPPDPPTNRGISLPLWNEYCISTTQTWRCGKGYLKFTTEEDTRLFYRWYFTTKGLNELLEQFKIPDGLVPFIMDLRTQHSQNGCITILTNAYSLIGKKKLTQDIVKELVTASRVKYILDKSMERKNSHLRRDFRGLVTRAYSAKEL